MQRTYTDIFEQTHVVKITLRERRMLKEQLEVDLLECAVKPESLLAFMERVSSEDDFLLRVLSVITGQSIEELEQQLDGESFVQAATAVVEAAVDFFPPSSVLKEPLRKVLKTARDHTEAATETMQAALMSGVNAWVSSTFYGAADLQRSGSGESPPSLVESHEPAST